MIFDGVITGFGRLGTPFAFEAFGVQPDLVTCAKGMTNATVPMGRDWEYGEIFGPARQKIIDARH